jgi:hypothetical protein
MKKSAIALVALGAAWGAQACVYEATPVQRAGTVARLQCGDPLVSQDEMRVLRETTVVKAEPITFLAGASTRTEGGQTVSGAKLVVLAPDGVSDLEMTRILRCHSARALLGQIDPATLQDDPFYLPDTWIDIDVKAERGFLVVKLSADRVWQNLAILHRATAYAQLHHQSTSSP